MHFSYRPASLHWPIVLAAFFIALFGGLRAGLWLADWLDPAPRTPTPLSVALFVGGGLFVALAVVFGTGKLFSVLDRFVQGWPLVVSKAGLRFSLPSGISGFVNWKDIESVSFRWRLKLPTLIIIEFSEGPFLERYGRPRGFLRIVLNEDRLSPSGSPFVDTANAYLAKAKADCPPATSRLRPLRRRRDFGKFVQGRRIT